MIRYGKSSDSILSLKSSFLENNDALREQLLAIGRLYAAQPRRKRCKICHSELAREPDFRKHGVGYVFCGRCGHLNGQHEDTEAFCAAVYTDDGGRSYAANYAAPDRAAYRKRVTGIYRPKAEFLSEALTSLGERPEALTYMDLGAGAGYFVAALRELGLVSSHGHEVSRAQVADAATMLGPDAVHLHGLAELPLIAGREQADVASMIGVLEHLRDPRAVLAALRDNAAVRYVFISVPLFSSSVFIETVFPEVMPRHLAGGHTHLFTE
ncbi:MAG: class I SAM-dependent methyltransferase, partial [Alphaproteobacteria bacterium]|nr:class I SAM-dependent methyltransferase [Alphaproteobacteria bacterium]